MRYLVSDAAVGSDGRQVRCASCGHEWFQEPPKPESFKEILEKEEAVAEPIPDAVKPIPEKAAAPVLPKEKSTARTDGGALGGRLMGYAAAAAVCLLFAGALVLFRDPVARAWPPSMLLYDLIGTDIPLPGEGLIIDRITVSAVRGADGQENLQIGGSIINLKRDTRVVPRLLATLQDEASQPMESWIIDLPHGSIGGEETFDFKAEYPGVPPEARAVNLSFAAFIPKKKAAAETPPVDETAEERAGKALEEETAAPAHEKGEGDEAPAPAAAAGDHGAH